MRFEMNSTLEYRVQPFSPEAHVFAVELRVAPPPAGDLLLSLPAWIPGSYLIRNFARHLIRPQAADPEGDLPLEKRDKQTWCLAHRGLPLVIRWQVYAWDGSVRGAFLDDRRGYFNGPALFLGVRGLEGLPCRVEIQPPQGPAYANWRLATSLRPLAAEPFGFGTYQADDYGDLIDHPVEMGTFSLIPFHVLGVPHWLALTGHHRADEVRLKADLSRICATQAALFGELPLDRYLFLAQVTADGYGGLEHRFSTSLLCAREELPAQGMGQATPGYQRFLGLCSHEYFHLWHVKRIRPRAFMEQGLEREVHTRLLWVFEGITSYYDDLALVRGGCIDEAAYLGLLAEAITRVLRTPGRLVQTLAESSFDAWTKFYQPDENSPNTLVSYYAKGALVALALDLTIRRDTAGECSLDDVMRALWERHGRTRVGLEERGFEALAMAVTGLDLGDFFHQALDTTDDLDLAPLLAELGIGLRLRAARQGKDFGGLAPSGAADAADAAARETASTVADFFAEGTARTAAEAAAQSGPMRADRSQFQPQSNSQLQPQSLSSRQVPSQAPTEAPAPSLGIRLRPEGTEPVIATVFTASPAQAAGLAPGDTLVALDGLRISRDNLDKLLLAAGEGAEVEIHAFRQDELQVRRARLAPAPLDTCELWLMADAPPRAQARRAAWLGGRNHGN